MTSFWGDHRHLECPHCAMVRLAHAFAYLGLAVMSDRLAQVDDWWWRQDRAARGKRPHGKNSD